MQQELTSTNETMTGLQEEVKTIHTKNEEFEARIEKMVTKVETAKRSSKGKANLQKGTQAQSKAAMAVEAAFTKNQTIFSKDYKLKTSLFDINVKLANGKGNEVDFFGILEAINGAKPKEYALIGEVKHHKKNKVGEAAVDKFVDSIGVIKRDARKQKAICMFVSNTGFVKKAIPILERNQVIYGTLQEVLAKISL